MAENKKMINNTKKSTETKNENCVFCKIAIGEIPCDKVWENEEFISFADINPFREGHTLVIPKKHFNNLMDLDENTSKKYLNAIKKTAEILIQKHNTDGFNTILNNGKSAGQIINHIHFHIHPRKRGDKKRNIFVG